MDNTNYEFLFSKPIDPKNLKNEPVFENKFLERLTVTNPLIAFVSYVPLVTLAAVYSMVKGFTTSTLAIIIWVSGFVFWSLAEYLIHRYFYHHKFENRIIKRIQFLFHGFHHKHPRDKHHLFMPFYGGWPVAGLFWLIFYIAIRQYSFIFFSGFYSGYLFYVFTHYYIHRFPPPFTFMKPLWKHHLIHHYKFPDKAFGFSTRIWDRIFGTMPT